MTAPTARPAAPPTPTFGSTFSGIGGLEVALQRAGWGCRWQIEIDGAANRVLARRWPDVRRYGDIAAVDPAELEPVELLCGGFPCQDLSMAGARAGLAGARSGLFREFVRLAAGLRPRWLLIENVPGLLSSNGGRDMGTVVGALAELGYGWAYRCLDAQHFGLAQRRLRVFIVGCLGDPARAAQVLFEPAGGVWDPPPRREAGARVAASLTSGVARARGVNPPGRRGEDDVNIVGPLAPNAGPRGHDAGNFHCNQAVDAGHIIADTLTVGANQTTGVNGDDLAVDAPALAREASGQAQLAHREDADTYVIQDAAMPRAKAQHGMGDAHAGEPMYTLDGDGSHAVAHSLTVRHGVTEDGTGRGTPLVACRQDVAHALIGEGHDASEDGSGRGTPLVIGWHENLGGSVAAADQARALRAGASKSYQFAQMGMAVRRLTPLECCRLQGFPDDWLDVEGLSDSARYRLLGNAVAVPVAGWIARRMLAVPR